MQLPLSRLSVSTLLPRPAPLFPQPRLHFTFLGVSPESPGRLTHAPSCPHWVLHDIVTHAVWASPWDPGLMEGRTTSSSSPSEHTARFRHTVGPPCWTVDLVTDHVGEVGSAFLSRLRVSDKELEDPISPPSAQSLAEGDSLSRFLKGE